MSQYQDLTASAANTIAQNGSNWKAIQPEMVTRMRLQNRFKTGLDIARYTARIMRADMAAYDADPARYTQSLGVWHGLFMDSMCMDTEEVITPSKQYPYYRGRDSVQPPMNKEFSSSVIKLPQRKLLIKRNSNRVQRRL